MKKTAFITGATSGIGLATARAFAGRGIDLVLCGRRQERLEAIAKELSIVNVAVLAFDVSSRSETEKAIRQLPSGFHDIDILINNAGNAHGFDVFQEADMHDWELMIDINVKGLLYVTRSILAGMVQRNKGHIINVGSIAGKEMYPKGNVYAASKHAVNALTEGMRMDLIDTNIKVGVVNPGMVNTEFSEVRFKGDRQRADAVYKGMQPLLAEDVAEIILFMVSCPPHVNISDLTVLPTAQASATIVRREV